MANNIYTIDLLVTGTQTITLTDDGTGSDWLVYSGSYPTYSEITLNWTSTNGNATSAEGIYYNPGNTGHRLIVTGVIENARGSNGADWVTGNQLGNILYGDNLATGIGGNDTINGADGADRIYGGSGADVAYGGSGNDLIWGDAGADTLIGDAGNDTITGGAGADSLSGGASARDTVNYSTSSAGVRVDITYGTTTTGIGGDAQGDKINGFADVIGSAYGDVIRDTVAGTIAFDYNANRFNGGAGADTLYLGGGNDTGIGGLGNDFLYGEAGNDALYGGSESDYLTGHAGLDRLYGGTSADRFIFRAVTDSTYAATGRDIIYDFSHAEGDKISLAYIDTRAAAGDQAFTFRGNLAFSGTLGEVRTQVSGANTYVLADMNGDKSADMSILVLNTTALVVGDFML